MSPQVNTAPPIPPTVSQLGLSSLQGHPLTYPDQQSYSTPPSYNTTPYGTTPSPSTFPWLPQRVPTVTENILVLYCKDQLLQDGPGYRRSASDYCQEVSDLVDTLSLLSNKSDDSGQIYQAYKITYDRRTLDGMQVSNLLLWSDNAISGSSIILLLCSPQLAAMLCSGDDVVEMEQAKFNKNSLIGAFPNKTVIPVFLNMPKQAHWIPQPLQSANSYSVNIKALQEACVGVANEEEWSARVSQAFQDNAELDDLVKLWKVLRKDVPSTLPSVAPPITVRESISQLKLNELAPEVSFIWQELGTRLGVSFTVQQRIQRTPVDITQKTIIMFDEWIQCKRQAANKDTLVQALRSCKCHAIADKVQKTFT